MKTFLCGNSEECPNRYRCQRHMSKEDRNIPNKFPKLLAIRDYYQPGHKCLEFLKRKEK